MKIIKFNINDYNGKYVMHCKTEEEAKDFCRYLDSVGKKWHNGESYLHKTNWKDYQDETYYCFNMGAYMNGENCYFNKFTVLEWSDFMDKKFTKADLKSGDVILRRNGEVEIVCMETGTLINKDGFDKLSEISEIMEDLNNISFDNDDWDIIAVRRPTQPHHCQFCAFEEEYGDLVYERQDEPEEMTLEEVCKALGKEIKIVKNH